MYKLIDVRITFQILTKSTNKTNEHIGPGSCIPRPHMYRGNKKTEREWGFKLPYGVVPTPIPVWENASYTAFNTGIGIVDIF